MVSFSFSFSFMPHATQRGHGFCVRVARSCVQTRLCVIRTCDRPFRGLRTRVPRKRRRHKWACAAIRLLRCYAALRTADGREMVSATGLQDSDYETLIKNKKIELRFVLENNQIIKRLG